MRFMVRCIFDKLLSEGLSADERIYGLLVYDLGVKAGRKKMLKVDFSEHDYLRLRFKDYVSGDLLLLSISIESRSYGSKYFTNLVGLDVMNYRLSELGDIVEDDRDVKAVSSNEERMQSFAERRLRSWLESKGVVYDELFENTI